MTLEEYYVAINGDYDQIFSQLGDDDVILEFLNKFFVNDDVKKLGILLENKQYKEAFMVVHNIKGYGLNMALTQLYTVADELCNVLRNGKPPVDCIPLFKSLESVYDNMKTVFISI